MDVIIRDVKNLSHKQYLTALGMTIRPVSLMREAAVSARKKNWLFDAVAIMLKDKGVYVGWSLIELGDPEEYRDDNIRPVYFNVKTKYRRRGYGTFLFHVAKGWMVKNGFRMEVFPHSEDSQGFFDTVRNSRPRTKYTDI